MSKLTLHLQYEFDELDEFVARCQGKLKYIKGVNCYPNMSNVRTIGRVYVLDSLSNDLVLQGGRGVGLWIDLCRAEYEKHPHVYAWQGPNEFIIDSYDRAARFNEFHTVYIRNMSRLGLRVMAGNINTGWPRLGKFNDALPYPPVLRPTIEALVEHDGILSLHEYGPGEVQEDGTVLGSMKFGVGANCLRYRNTVAELREAGVPIPRIFIGETGIDVPDPAFPLDHHHRGWTEFVSADEYAEQLRWYAGELEQDDYIIGAAVFTACNWDWVTFNVTRDLAWKVAEIVAWEPEVTSHIPDSPPEEELGTYNVIDMVDKLKVRATPTKVIIHHSAGRQRPANVRRHIRAIAGDHVRRNHWCCVGYDYIFDADGNIYHVNRDQIVNYHAGDWQTNLESLGFCFLGMEPTPEQLDAMRWLIQQLGITEVIPHKAVVRANGEKVRTACPGKWRKWGKEIVG